MSGSFPPESPDSELWRLAPCGGCARKVPARTARRFAELAEHSRRADFMADAALVGLGAGQTTALTIDFITPIAPRLEDYGHIAAANALSDVYAVGYVPRFALAVSCVPQGPATEEFLIALEAAAVCLAKAGCVLVGGHSVVDPEPKLGFAVVGTPNRTGRDLSTGARPGDALILTKPLGVGILTSAYRAGLIERAELEPAISTMSRLNDFVIGLVEGPLGEHISAATDVTGFGLLGHLKELCARCGVGAMLDVGSVPLLPEVARLAAQGVSTSAATANREYVAAECTGLSALPPGEQIVLTDPQTSGGLLLAVHPRHVDAVLRRLPHDVGPTAVIGRCTDRAGHLAVAA